MYSKPKKKGKKGKKNKKSNKACKFIKVEIIKFIAEILQKGVFEVSSNKISQDFSNFSSIQLFDFTIACYTLNLTVYYREHDQEQ